MEINMSEYHLHRTVRFGLNYTPGKRWYYLWNDWHPEEIEADLAALASLGIDHIRVQMIWPWFQPNPTWVSPGHLDRLCELLAIAVSHHLDVVPTLLTGFLSGYFFLPANLSRQQVMTDEAVIQAELLYVRKVMEAIADCPNVLAIDLGNEVNCLHHELPAEQGDAWAKRISAAIREVNPNIEIVNGIDHTPVFAGSTFSMTHLCNDYDSHCWHAWPKFTGALERGSLREGTSTYLAGFFAALGKLYENCESQPLQTDKPIWLQEFGCCDKWGTLKERQTYLRETIAHGVTAGISRFTFWCSHDKPRDLSFTEDEYHYGLFSPDNEPKPLAELYAELIKQHSEAQVGRSKQQIDSLIVVPETLTPRFAQPEAPYMQRMLSSNAWGLFDLYRDAVDRVRAVRFVREATLSEYDEEIEVVRVFLAS